MLLSHITTLLAAIFIITDQAVKLFGYKQVAKRITNIRLTKIYTVVKKCVAFQRKSSLSDKVRTFFMQKREELKQDGRKQQDERNAGE